MNRIDATFAELKKHNKKAIIPFITAGDPNLDTTYELVLSLEKAGASLIELGVPFSDPVAEGPVLQAASVRALENGTRLDDILNLVERLRQKTQMPILLMMYANNIFRFGKTAFFARCCDVGVDGIIVPDVPLEEHEEFAIPADQCGIHCILLVAPTSRQRLHEITKVAKGFLYCVSSLGVTGMRTQFADNLTDFMAQIREQSNVPTCIGFGISHADHILQLKDACDGLIVGSALVDILSNGGRDAVQKATEFVASLRKAADTH